MNKYAVWEQGSDGKYEDAGFIFAPTARRAMEIYLGPDERIEYNAIFDVATAKSIRFNCNVQAYFVEHI